MTSTSSSTTQQQARFVVGIDLGTTNCAVGFVDSDQRPWHIETFMIAQWTDWGQIERRKTLPSFHYQLTDDLQQALGKGLPWETSPSDYVVGMLARDAGMRQPGRRISSAKSWLSHDQVDRSAELLPWHGDADVQRLSPVDVSARYLTHIRDAWDHDHPEHPLGEQDVVVTLPASFDEVARELTVAAAKKAGLRRIYLIEEPQAAFYAWIDKHRENWHETAREGDLILVCDIGGGTSDFTLIRVRKAGTDPISSGGDPGGQVQFHRVAVGSHLILGGDNLDLALAKFAEHRISPQQPLAPRDWDRLIQACRNVKETMLSENRPGEYSISLTGQGSRVVGGARTTMVTADDIDRVLVDGFFPLVARDVLPEQGESGFREFGLPFAHDPAVTKHLAAFLNLHARAGLDANDKDSATSPRLVLFNGGVMASGKLRQRIVQSIADWFGDQKDEFTVLDADRLDLAVAHGAAYFGMVRRGEGVRIAANLARSYYAQVADQPPETMCVIPGSAEAGQTFSPSNRLRLELGTPVQFPLWVSSTRLADSTGDLVPIDRGELSPLPPIRTVLTRGKKREQQSIDVAIVTELSEIGTLGLFAVDESTGQRWRLEFDIRSTLETDRDVHTGKGESQGIVDSDLVESCMQVVRATFAETDNAKISGKPTLIADPISSIEPSKVTRFLREVSGMDRAVWPPSLLRDVWQELMNCADGRKRSASHESRWLNLVGYCLRPGYGMAVDDWRVSEVWRTVHGKLAFPTPATRTESLILWRRIAGGLTSGQQLQLIIPLISTLSGRSGKLESHEASEMWRLAGSLEWISAEQKLKLIDAAFAHLKKPVGQAQLDALVWAIGRLASRKPIYGPLNAVVSTESASGVVSKLIMTSRSATPSLLKTIQLAVAQIAGMTGDRYRDVGQETRDEATAWLTATSAPTHYVTAVEQATTLQAEDESALFGDTLPLGIRLVR